MAATAGKGGSMSYSGITVLIQSWTLDYAADMLEITAFSDAGVEKSIVGIKRWTATATGPLDSTNTADVGDTATLTLYVVDSGVNWAGTAWIESISDSVDVQGVNMRTYNFKGNGTLTPVS
jgi:hypothetical protein